MIPAETPSPKHSAEAIQASSKRYLIGNKGKHRALTISYHCSSYCTHSGQLTPYNSPTGKRLLFSPSFCRVGN